jgi:hypothetical protein
LGDLDNEMDEACGTCGGDKKYRVPVRKYEEHRPFSRPRHRWEDNVQQDGRACTRLIWLRMGTSSW